MPGSFPNGAKSPSLITKWWIRMEDDVPRTKREKSLGSRLNPGIVSHDDAGPKRDTVEVGFVGYPLANLNSHLKWFLQKKKRKNPISMIFPGQPCFTTILLATGLSFGMCRCHRRISHGPRKWRRAKLVTGACLVFLPSKMHEFQKACSMDRCILLRPAEVWIDTWLLMTFGPRSQSYTHYDL